MKPCKWNCLSVYFVLMSVSSRLDGMKKFYILISSWMVKMPALGWENIISDIVMQSSPNQLES